MPAIKSFLAFLALVFGLAMLTKGCEQSGQQYHIDDAPEQPCLYDRMGGPSGC
jgi:hypothetical protein